MIDPKAITTYAQYNEDIILAALLHGVKDGFYIDVGANYHDVDSVTKYFYDRGWSGINIEPIASLHKKLVENRPRDINLQCGLGEKEGMARFREYTQKPGHSTFALSQSKSSNSADHHDTEVPIITLNQLFEEYKLKTVDFIKIDVEGYEYHVIAGNNWAKNRPKVICVEANRIAKDWRPMLEKNRYRLFIRDSINEFYVANEAWQLTRGFDERVIVLDYHALKQHQQQSWSADSKELVRLHEIVAETTAQLEKQLKERQSIEALSLTNQTYPRRVKRAVVGLTVNWWHYRQHKKNQKKS